jgi:hypothetical protein
MKKAAFLLSLALACVAGPTLAQNPGVFPSGTVYGNSGASSAQPSARTLTAMFDRAFCGTNNSALARISGTWACLASANNSVWVTSAAGVPSLSTTLPSAVQSNITALGTIASGVWNGSVIGQTYGGFGANISAASGVPLFATGTPTFTATSGTGDFARVASPAFTGNPTAPTATLGDNDTTVATTAFVQSALVTAAAVSYTTRAAAIAATVPAAATGIQLLGYSAAGDAGAGATYIVMACPAVTAPDFQDAGGRCWHLTVSNPVLGFFGADATGVADSTAAINSFITYTFSRELCGKFQVGTYKFAGPIIINGTTSPGNGPCFDGEGIGSTTFNNTNLNQHDFILDNNTAGMNGGRLSNFGFNHASAKTAGFGIIQVGAQGANNLEIKGIQFQNTFGAISIARATNCILDGIYIYSIGLNGQGINLDGSGGNAVLGCDIDNLFVLNGTGGGNTTAIKIGDNVGAVNFLNCHLQAGAPTPIDRGVWISGTSVVDYIKFKGCYVDVFQAGGVLIQGGTQIEFAGGSVQFSSASSIGMEITGGSWIWVHSNLFYGNQGHGIAVTSGAKDVRIYNNTFNGNGVGTANTYDDINIGANTTNFSITGNNHCLTGETPYARYNVNVVAGTSDYYQITSNIVGSTGSAAPHCHRTAGVFDGGTGTIKNVSGNPGAAWQTWTPTITCGGGTPITITANAARYEIAAPRVSFNVQITATDIGTCTGTLNVSLPVAAQATSSYIGAFNSTTATAKNAVTAPSFPRVDVFANGGVFPVVNGDVLRITGTYEAVAP